MKTNHDGTITLNAYDTWTACNTCGQRVTGDSIHTCSPQLKTLTDEEDTKCQYCKQGCIRCDARKLLTDEEIRQIAVECGVYINEQGSIYPDDICIYSFARAILRKAQE